MYRTHVVRRGDALTVIQHGGNHDFELIDPLRPPGARGAGDDRVVAPIPARVTHVLVRAHDVVSKGAPLIVLEAMKMEITLTAPRDGTIDVIRYAVGDMVEEGTELIHFVGPRAEDDALSLRVRRGKLSGRAHDHRNCFAVHAMTRPRLPPADFRFTTGFRRLRLHLRPCIP